MRQRARPIWIGAVVWMWLIAGHAAELVPEPVRLALGASGLPLQSFGVYVQPVEGHAPPALAALNAERPFPMASTAKLVTSLAALDLLGTQHGWRTRAFATGPVVDGRLAGDLVLAGDNAGLTTAQLARWFRQMRGEGLTDVRGRIVLDRLALLHEDAPPAQPHDGGGTDNGAARADMLAKDVQVVNRSIVVAVQPAAGKRAKVTLRPKPLGVVVVNDVFMDGACNAWAQWTDTGGGTSRLWVRGRWDASCGARDIAYVRAPTPVTTGPRLAARRSRSDDVSASTLVASLWTQAGGSLRGGVVEGARPNARAVASRWSSQFTTPLPDVIREINKNSNNVAARRLLLSLSAGAPSRTAPLQVAQQRVRDWLRGQGLDHDDIRIELGSGQSRAERGKPRALVQLLHNAWHTKSAQAFVDSLPVAGVDGTLGQRMRGSPAAGQAFLKTGTLSDTRALAGYVRGRSGTVYAVAALVNHPRAARATPALDKLIEWVAANG